MFSPNQADMAQLVEQRIRNAWVGGSSPPIGSRQEKRGTFLSFFVYMLSTAKIWLEKVSKDTWQCIQG